MNDATPVDDDATPVEEFRDISDMTEAEMQDLARTVQEHFKLKGDAVKVAVLVPNRTDYRMNCLRYMYHLAHVPDNFRQFCEISMAWKLNKPILMVEVDVGKKA